MRGEPFSPPPHPKVQKHETHQQQHLTTRNDKPVKNAHRPRRCSWCVCVRVCVCVCVCVCVDGMNLKYALRWHIHISVHSVLYASVMHKHSHTRILKPFEDSEQTGLKVDIAHRSTCLIILFSQCTRSSFTLSASD